MTERRTIIIDDDPTGCQTVSNIPILLSWDKELLRSTLRDNGAVFILTNTRAMSASEAEHVSDEVCGNLKSIAEADGYSYNIISRSDSTLRGHLRVEAEAIMRAFPANSRLVIAPVFFECGRITEDNVHYLVKDGVRIAAGETEFAKDPSFGYKNSDLRLWVDEVSGGRFSTDRCITIDAASCTAQQFISSSNDSIFIINATGYEDLDKITACIKEAEMHGLNFIFRTAASFVRSYLGQGEKDFITPGAQDSHGLVVAGSYTDLTTKQLEMLTKQPGMTSIEIDIDRISKEYCEAVSKQIDGILPESSCLMYTSRGYKRPPEGMTQLDYAAVLSAALCNIVAGISKKPGFIIAKGGITSLTIARDALKIQKTTVLGQMAAGVPVWKDAAGMYYVVFPGNVGSERTLADVYKKFL